jgi:hypothetical protein
MAMPAMAFVSSARSDKTLNAVVAMRARVKRYRFILFIRVRFKLISCLNGRIAFLFGADADGLFHSGEAMAAMASGKKAEFYRRRLQKGMEWDKKAKTWKWMD